MVEEQHAPEPRRPTIRMVAERAGVSTATVSYVLRGIRASISDGTAERVRLAAEELGYRANAAARTMRTGRNGLVLLSLHRLNDPWSVAVQESVADAAAPHGLTPLVQGSGDWFTTASKVQPDVLYLDAVTKETYPQVKELAQAGQRVVVFSDVLEPDGFGVVRSVAGPGARLAVEHLCAFTSDVAYLAPPRLSLQADRYEAYSAAVRSGAISREVLLRYDGSRIGAFRTAVSALRPPSRPRAILCNTDYAALATIQAAQSLGLRIPEDVAVVGLGNTPEGAEASPSLTSGGPLDFFVGQADQIVKAAISSSPPHFSLDFPWTLIHRESTPRAGSAPLVKGTP